MKMAGAVIIYNTDFCKMKILKWAFLCALTQDCIAPHGAMKGCGKPNWWMYDHRKIENETSNANFQSEPRFLHFLYDQVERYTDAYEMQYLTLEKITRRKNPETYKICHRYDQ